jgi:hypothetical protein
LAVGATLNWALLNNTHAHSVFTMSPIPTPPPLFFRFFLFLSLSISSVKGVFFWVPSYHFFRVQFPIPSTTITLKLWLTFTQDMNWVYSLCTNNREPRQ